MVGKVRFEDFDAVAPAKIAVDLSVTLAEMTGAQVVDVNRSVRVQDFSMLHGDFGSALRL